MRRTAKSFARCAVAMTALAAMLGGTGGCGTSSSFATVSHPVSVTVVGPGEVRLNGSAQFAANVSGTANTAVTWQVNGVNGGSAATGTVSSAGLYIAPAVLPAPNAVTITAISQADPTETGSATETVLNLVPTLTSGTATQSGSGGVVSLDVIGTNFVNGIQLQVGGSL